MLLACFTGTLIQGAIGFGFALVAVPALLLVEPGAVPVTSLVLALPIVVTMALRERRSVDVRGFAQLTAGRVPGTAAGAWVVGVAGARLLAGLIGALLLLAAALSATTRARPGNGARLAAGFVSGVMGTVASIGGPAMALAFQERPGPELRATLAVAFAVGVLLSLGALALAGEVRGWQVGLALVLAPAVVVGLWLGRRVTGRLDERWLRPAVLAFAGAAGLAAVLRALL